MKKIIILLNSFLLLIFLNAFFFLVFDQEIFELKNFVYILLYLVISNVIGQKILLRLLGATRDKSFSKIKDLFGAKLNESKMTGIVVLKSKKYHSNIFILDSFFYDAVIVMGDNVPNLYNKQDIKKILEISLQQVNNKNALVKTMIIGQLMLFTFFIPMLFMKILGLDRLRPQKLFFVFDIVIREMLFAILEFFLMPLFIYLNLIAQLLQASHSDYRILDKISKFEGGVKFLELKTIEHLSIVKINFDNNLFELLGSDGSSRKIKNKSRLDY